MTGRSGKLAALCVALAIGGAVAAQPNWDAVEIKAQRVAEGVWALEGRGGNIGVSAGPDGVFLVDDQFQPLAPKIRAAVAQIDSGPIRFVINTHYHHDHTGGNEAFAKSGVLVLAHDNVRRRLSVEEWIRSLEDPAAGMPVVTFGDRVTFHLNGDEIDVFHVERAHTDGDSIVHFRKADVVHMGDVFFNGLYPYIDVDAGGSVDGVIAACDAVLERSTERTRFIPGHGPVTGREGLVFYRDLLADVRRRIAGMIAEGKSLEQIQAAKPSQAYDAEWGNDFISPEKLAESVYRSLEP